MGNQAPSKYVLDLPPETPVDVLVKSTLADLKGILTCYRYAGAFAISLRMHLDESVWIAQVIMPFANQEHLQEFQKVMEQVKEICGGKRMPCISNPNLEFYVVLNYQGNTSVANTSHKSDLDALLSRFPDIKPTITEVKPPATKKAHSSTPPSKSTNQTEQTPDVPHAPL